MQKLSAMRLGYGFAIASAVVYFACAVTMALFPKSAVISIANAFMHGVDVTSILRTDIPIGEAIFGLVATAIMGWIIGALIAASYNLTGGRPDKPTSPTEHLD